MTRRRPNPLFRASQAAFGYARKATAGFLTGALGASVTGILAHQNPHAILSEALPAGIVAALAVFGISNTNSGNPAT